MNSAVTGYLTVDPKGTPRPRARVPKGKKFAMIYNETWYKDLLEEYTKQIESDMDKYADDIFPVESECRVDVSFYYTKDYDIDNLQKALFDAMVYAKLIRDDMQIKQVTVWKDKAFGSGAIDWKLSWNQEDPPYKKSWRKPVTPKKPAKKSPKKKTKSKKSAK